MQRRRADGNALQKAPNLSFTRWLLCLCSLLMLTQRLTWTSLQMLGIIWSLLTTILCGMFLITIYFCFMLMPISRLCKEYRTFNKVFGQMGAGLQYDNIDEGSTLVNLVGKYTLFWPSTVITFTNHSSQRNLSRTFHIGSTYMVFGALFPISTLSLSHWNLARISQLRH